MAEIKQVMVVRTDLEMGKGKIAAQVAHAALESAEESMHMRTSWYQDWKSQGQAKIVLKGTSDAQLHELFKKALDQERINKPTSMLKSPLVGDVLTKASQHALRKVFNIYNRYLPPGPGKEEIPLLLIGSLAKISHTISTILARSKKKRRSEAPGALARLCTGLWVTWSRWIRVPEARSLTPLLFGNSPGSSL